MRTLYSTSVLLVCILLLVSACDNRKDKGGHDSNGDDYNINLSNSINNEDSNTYFENTSNNTSNNECIDIGDKKIPIMDMTANQCYHNQDGGLYGNGNNIPPESHRKAALVELAKIQPLDKNGNPSSDGKIVFLSLGMSNARIEFDYFMQTIADKPEINSKLVVVNGAQNGQAVIEWATKENLFHNQKKYLSDNGVNYNQVQVIWAKFAVKGPTGEDFNNEQQIMLDNMKIVMQLAKKEYPNLKIVYLASRTYAGYAKINLSPEPYTYWDGFAIRQLILDQIAGESELNYDSSKGEVKAPLLLWGPYLWTDGTIPRSDGLIWKKEDVRTSDGTHPSEPENGEVIGAQKIANLLYDFFSTNELAKGWFLK